jgi:adenylate cyclase
MTTQEEHEAETTHAWHMFLTTGINAREQRQRHFFGLLPGVSRCKLCNAPFDSAGGLVARNFYGKHPSNWSPHLCTACEKFAREYQGGAEIELSLLFADVRGSTTIAERMTPLEFSKLINRFYVTSTRVMVETDALIEKITGDQVTGMYVPGLAGTEHAHRAVKAAQEILRVTGHGRPEGPWIPLGVGIHTGVAFVGTVGSEKGTFDMTVLGDAANTAARLASSASQGEILISDAAYTAAKQDYGPLEERELELKGKSERVLVHVLNKLG